MEWFNFSKKTLVFSVLSLLAMGQTASANNLRGAPCCNAAGDNCTVPTDDQPDIDTTQVASDFGSSSGPESYAPHMLGDYVSSLHYSSSSQGPLANGVRNFKFAENQSAAPVDRLYTNYSYFNDFGPSGGKTNQIQRWIFGGETVILNGNASIGARVPLYYVNPDLSNTFSAGTADRLAFGDIVGLFKYALINNGGDVLSTGLGWQFPTGSSTIGGVPPITGGLGLDVPQHDGSVQPFFAGIRQLGGGVFFQGFSALDIPIDTSDSIIWLNDFQLGFVARTYNTSGITALVPVFEVHSNSPWNRTLPGGLGYFSSLNITTGLTVELNNASTLNLGICCPIQDNHTFDYELIMQYNVFGGF